MPASSLRAEVLLLVRLAERHMSGCDFDSGTIGVVEAVETDAVIENDGDEEGFADYGSSLLHEFEGALAAAEATDLLSRERADWLRVLAGGFADPVEESELYEHGLTVHWHLLLEGPGGAGELLDDELVITDDLGTDYSELSGGSANWSGRAEGPYAVTGQTRRPTPVAAGAGELRVSRGAATWRIPLNR